MARYNKIYAGPAEQVKPQVVEAPANADILPGVLAVLSSGKFVAASASDIGRVYAIQDNYLIGKGVDDAIKANETAIGIELMPEQLLNLRLPTGVNVGKDAALTIGTGGKLALATSDSRIIGYAAEAYNNTSGADQLIHVRPTDTRLAPATAG